MADDIMLQSDIGPITKKLTAETLKNVGIEKGNIVMVHSRIFTIGKLAGLKDKKRVLNCFIDALLEVVGEEGTLIFPTFTLSVCKTGVFDILRTKSEVGVLSEIARNRQDSVRASHPFYSVAFIGKEKFQNVCVDTCFGENSIFDIIHKENLKDDEDVKLLSIGVEIPPSVFTYIHYIEEIMKVPYRYHKEFKGKLIDCDGDEKQFRTSFYVRDLDVPVVFDAEKCWGLWQEKKIVDVENFGNSSICAVSEADIYKVTSEVIKDDPEFLCLGGYDK
jgi:aminoglycoside 3-N-acetyltransferase